MGKCVLITGASNGIGYELSKVFASNGFDLVLVARNGQKLNDLKNMLEDNHGVSVQVIVKDLSLANAAMAVYAEIEKEHIDVDILVNNAGFGDYGEYAGTDWSKQADMVNVNLLALMQLTRLLLPKMIHKQSGKILNMASIAAFEPGPYMSVYYASKAFVLSFSEALYCELKGSGVTVTASCPGPTKSGFAAAAGEGTEQLFRAIKNATSEEVALFSYRALMRGKPVAIPGLRNKALVFVQRFVPRSMVRATMLQMQGNHDLRT